jgi:hypothetical protein
VKLQSFFIARWILLTAGKLEILKFVDVKPKESKEIVRLRY